MLNENYFFLFRVHLVSPGFVHGDSPIKTPLAGYYPGDFSKSREHWGVSEVGLDSMEATGNNGKNISLKIQKPQEQTPC